MSDVIVYVYMNSELFEPASCREELDLVRTSRCNIEVLKNIGRSISLNSYQHFIFPSGMPQSNAVIKHISSGLSG